MWKARRSTFFSRQPNAGFATVEVLVTVAIVVLIGTISILALGRSDRANLQDDVASVALTLQQARLFAAESGQPVEVTYSQEQRTLTTAVSEHELMRGVTSPTPTTTIRIRPSGESEGFNLVLVGGS